MRVLQPAERLIVAADFKPSGQKAWFEERPGSVWNRADRRWVKEQVLTLAQKLKGTGVYLKVNSALRASGYGLIDEIQSFGLRVFADLKLFDIGETLATDGALLREAKPELLTTVCVAGVSAMQALKAELPETEILAVTVLTSLKESDTMRMFHATVEASAMKFAMMAEAAGMDGLICAPTDVALIRSVIRREMSYNTPAIRPTWAIVPGDDQNPDRIMTPAKAIKAGADRIVVGRPIVKAENPYDAVMRTIDEIASATT
ncbi:MAG: orotidine-5'-phosphate decarboxylase [Candidatus Pacebacteria bacterium]|nr:orotidine-5'-phosphate decarboxylase [Candidatus Paceibacterota bacterium]